MTLVNFKKLFLNPENVLRILMSLIFISAGLFRIFHPSLAQDELLLLGLPTFLSWFLIIFEIGGGIYLLLKGRFWRKITFLFIFFLLFALLLAIKIDSSTIFNNFKELFVFDINSTDFFLHFVFLIILISLVLKRNR
jgi:uncharacterized membrane protein YphA (DoxX/SURF4 family)